MTCNETRANLYSDPKLNLQILRVKSFFGGVTLHKTYFISRVTFSGLLSIQIISSSSKDLFKNKVYESTCVSCKN